MKICDEDHSNKDLKNSFGGFISKHNTTKERISTLEDRSIESTKLTQEKKGNGGKTSE